MANAKKGELSVRLDGKTVSLALTFNALCELEDHFGETIIPLMTRLQDEATLSFREVRSFLHVVLRQKLPDATIEDAGRLIEENGLEVFGQLIERSRVLSSGDDATPGKTPPEREPAA